MITKYSIKKPMTVFVAVILSMILGAVAFTHMKTDLLPNIEMPYVMVVTVCPGFTPEKVENSVTKPLESSLSTVGGVENIRSQSSENMSMLAIEFSFNSNMDAAMIELNNRLVSVSAAFEETVGAPFMMQIDPDMLPVYVASISKKGADLAELTRLAQDAAIPAFERTDGVASVAAMGTLLNKIEITLNQEKIDAVNEKITDAFDTKTASALKQINDGKRALSDAKDQMEAQKRDASLKMARGGIALADGKAAIMTGIVAMQTAEAQAGQILELLEKFGPLLQTAADPEMAEDAASALLTLCDKIKKSGAVLGDLAARLENCDPAKIDWDALKAMLEDIPFAPEAVEQIRLYLSRTIGPQGRLTLNVKNLSLKISEKAAEIETFAGHLRDLSPGAISEKISSSISELTTSLQQAKTSLPAEKEELTKKLDELSGQQAQIEQGKILLATELASAEQQIQASEDKLNEGEAKIKETLKKAAGSAGLSGLLNEKTLKAMIAAQNFSMPAGYLEEGEDKFTVKVGDALHRINDLRDLPLLVSGEEDIGTITLNDVADIAVKDNSENRFAKVNGEDGILLTLQKQSLASTNIVSKNLRETVKQLEKEYPGLKIDSMMDQGIYIDIVIKSVLHSLLTGGILAVLILFVFLKNAAATMTVAFSIPISLMLAVVLMYFSGVSINIISLAGLALGVGMLVDNSIIVIENTYRLRSFGYSAGKAALKGAGEMTGAITASTLTTVCVFLPIVFTEGMSRQLFKDMGLTIGYSLLASLLVALSLVPVLSATMLRNLKAAPEGKLSLVKDIYGKMLGFCLKRKWLPLGLSLLLLVFAAYGATKLGTAFIPESAADQLVMTVSLPEDETVTTEKLRDRSMAVMNALREVRDVRTVGVYDSPDNSNMFGGKKKSLMLYIVMSENKSKSAKSVMEDIREKASSVPGCKAELSQGMNMTSFMERGPQIKIKGEKIEILKELAKKAADILKGTGGLENIDDGFGETAPEIRILVDKEKAMSYRLTVAQVFQQVAEAIKNSSNVTSISVDDEDMDVLLCKESRKRLTGETLKSYPLSAKDMMTGDVRTVLLGDIAEISMGENLSAIARENLKRVVTVKADLMDGYNIGLISRDLEKELSEIYLPRGYSISIEGENEMINTALHDIATMLLLAVIMIYLIMVAQFQSLTGPFVVMFTIPLAFTGGLVALWMFGFELSVISMLGFLVLAGVVVNNGIVFVDTANQLQKGGMARREALIATGKMRIRPIFMTAVTTVFGLTSLALGFGTGSDMVQPLAVVVVFGLSYATLLTLFVVPVLCDGIFMRKPMRDIEFD